MLLQAKQKAQLCKRNATYGMESPTSFGSLPTKAIRPDPSNKNVESFTSTETPLIEEPAGETILEPTREPAKDRSGEPVTSLL